VDKIALQKVGERVYGKVVLVEIFGTSIMPTFTWVPYRITFFLALFSCIEKTKQIHLVDDKRNVDGLGMFLTKHLQIPRSFGVSHKGILEVLVLLNFKGHGQ
jgi:hypothetical protein